MTVRPITNVYCDESAHLEHDGLRWMVLGALSCPQARTRDTAAIVRTLKAKHGLAPDFELKWTKVSPGRLAFYEDVIDAFFDDPAMRFRAVVIDKTALPSGLDHDAWYYEALFRVIEPLLDPDAAHRVYLDIKDTRSQARVAGLHDRLCDSRYDMDKEVVERVQQVRAHEVVHVQWCDLLVGAVASANRGDGVSPAKRALVERIRARSGLSLVKTTLVQEPKITILVWSPAAEGS